ncbi:hypothetical protein XENOCAPTIV_011166, partial [Xenoophorus captivus]
VNGSDISGLYALRHNTTLMDFSRADITPAVTSSRDAHHSTGVHFKPHPDEEEMCRPKYFIFNSQVAGEGCWTRTFSLDHKCSFPQNCLDWRKNIEAMDRNEDQLKFRNEQGGNWV